MSHGDERNRRTETTLESGIFELNGESIEAPIGGLTQTVSERWCDECETWVKSQGLLGTLFCHECKSTWRALV